jgi:hypothetical protein
MYQQIDQQFTTFNRARAWSLACMLALAACGGGGGGGDDVPPPPPPPPAVDLSAGLAAAASVTPGAALTYTASLVVTGNAVNSVTATLTLPASVTVGAISDGGTLAGNQVSWPAIATLAVGTATRTVEVTAPAVGPLDATLQLATTSTESTAGNNSAGRRTVIGFNTLATLTGAAPNDFFGFVADEVGDINGDGRPDFIVGAPFHDTAANDAGRAYVYSGATAAQLFTFDGPGFGSAFGWSVAAAGDVDGDGTGDLIVGGPGVFLAGGSSQGTGVARVYSGDSGAMLHSVNGPANGSRFGSAVAGIGDVNGDGRADLLVGAESSTGAGQAFVISGMDGATLRTHTGPAGTNYGYGLSGLGDVSGDVVSDYAIGGGQGAGSLVEVRSGADGALLYTVTPDASGNRLGFFWIDSVGDVNNDGRPDFFAGDIDDTGGRGRGYVFSGSNGAIVHRFTGQGTGDNFGISHNAGYDVDGDAVPDIFVAGYHNDEGANDGGKGYVYSGATGGLLRTMTGTQSTQSLGYDAVQLGDVDGDGVVDYLLTGDQENGQPGTLLVIRGTDLP